MGRSVLAVVAGYLFLTILGRSASYVLAYVFPPSAAAGGQFVIPMGLAAANLVVGFVAALGAGHTCARVARKSEMAHVAFLAGILAAIGIGLIANPPSGVPRAWASFEVLTGVVGVLIGGVARTRSRAG